MLLTYDNHQRHESALANVEHLQRDLENIKSQPGPSYPESSSSSLGREEISRLTSELENLRQKYSAQSDVTERLKIEMESLMETLKELNSRQDELFLDREADQARLEEAESEVIEWKRRYESAKSELRNLKGNFPYQASAARALL